MTRRPTTLAECPVGLFWAGDDLCMKTEYGNNDGRIDAFIVSSGEFFWGSAPQTIASQRATIVRPIKISELPRKQQQPPAPPTISAEDIGMRDHFAGQALIGQLAFSPSDEFDKAHEPAEVAALAYRFADAMLAERAKAIIA